MQTLSSMFKALADKNRLRIMAALLQHDELCVCQLTEFLGVAGATASRHLSLLQKANLVQSRKVGRWVYCRLRNDLPHEFPMDWLKEHLLEDSEIVKNMERLRVVLAESPEAICRKQRGEISPAGECSQNRTKKKILFLCTGNSCRSQMAEGWTNYLHSDYLEAHSAGIEAHGLNLYSVEVMNEAGIDLSGHRSRQLDEFDLQSFDVIITLCDHAHESCPFVPPGCRLVHKGFDDPPRLARNLESKEEILQCYRRIRDEIMTYVQSFPASLPLEEKEK